MFWILLCVTSLLGFMLFKDLIFEVKNLDKTESERLRNRFCIQTMDDIQTMDEKVLFLDTLNTHRERFGSKKLNSVAVVKAFFPDTTDIDTENIIKRLKNG